MQRRYVFRVDPELSDALSGCLFSAGAEGIEDRGSALVAYAEEELGRELCVAFEGFRKHIAVAFPELLPPLVEVEEVDLAQATAWLENLPPVLLTDTIWFCPVSRRAEPPAPENVLWFEPRAAFGSGEHPTTRLASRALADIAGAAKEGALPVLLDVGTGSGVLGVLALWLGWERVVGTDIQEEAIEAARTNAALNGFEGRLSLHLGSFAEGSFAEGSFAEGSFADDSSLVDSSQKESGRYPWIVANIDRGTLLDLAPELALRLEPHGALLLTGLLVEDMAEVREAYVAQGLELSGSATEGEWALLRLSRPVR